MSTEPTPAEEPPDIDPEKIRIERVRISGIAKHEIERAIERANETRDSLEREVKLKRSEEWVNRALSAVAGAAITIFFVVCISQCCDINHRLLILESKQAK